MIEQTLIDKSSPDSARVLEQLQDRKPVKGTVVYYPQFASQDAFDNHYHRALWYLPFQKQIVGKVVLGVLHDFATDRRPDFMCAPRQSTAHIALATTEDEYLQALGEAQLVLIHEPCSPEFIDKLQKTGKKVLNVTTDDLNEVEYGNYAKIHWFLMKPEERQLLLDRSYQRFVQVAGRIREKCYKAAVVFGTGPSIDTAVDYDFSDCFTVACNTVVQDKELLEHIKPDFLAAGDVVSHFGVSQYAEKYREDLVRALNEHDAYFLTTAQFANLLRLQYPEISNRIFLCNQTSKGPVFDLEKDWQLPRMDSVFNIHMMPVAASFADHIFILGCDGKNPDESKNEDFWGHSERAQYHDLVDTGHQAHPVFDVHRQKNTYDGYLRSVTTTVEQGEMQGKQYLVLAPSFTPPLAKRLIPDHMLWKNADGLLKFTKAEEDEHDISFAGSDARFDVKDAPKRRILIVARASAHVYSGGRYHAFLAGEALALRGHDVTIWASACPLFWNDFSTLPAHGKIKLCESRHFKEEPEGVFDFVLVVPDGTLDETVYKRALDIARRDRTRVSLLSFEPPNWFNAMSPQKREERQWFYWVEVSRFADLILVSANESKKYTKDFYKNLPASSKIRYSFPSINSHVANTIPTEPAGKQIIVITRFGPNAMHKGVEDVEACMDPALRGYTLALIIGTGTNPDSKEIRGIMDKSERYGIKVKLLRKISDEEKFREIAASQFMVFPSYFEGFGYPPVEALYMGRPCIAYDIPVIREVSGDNLTYVPVGDTKALRQSVLEQAAKVSFEHHPELRAAARKIVSLEVFGRNLESLIEEVFHSGANLPILAYSGTLRSHVSSGRKQKKEQKKPPPASARIPPAGKAPRKKRSIIKSILSIPGEIMGAMGLAAFKIILANSRQGPFNRQIISLFQKKPKAAKDLVDRMIRNRETMHAIADAFADNPQAVGDIISIWGNKPGLAAQLQRGMSYTVNDGQAGRTIRSLKAMRAITEEFSDNPESVGDIIAIWSRNPKLRKQLERGFSDIRSPVERKLAKTQVCCDDVDFMSELFRSNLAGKDHDDRELQKSDTDLQEYANPASGKRTGR